MSDKIDVVVSWVNGGDPLHVAKRNQFGTARDQAHSDASTDTRFGDCGEIYYCIASILKYAKFINRIWIITDNQKPEYLPSFADAGLCKPEFIQVVDHRTIFKGYESALPTFSSLSIESMIWRIPGLAERFVYLNDDFFINHPLEPGFFFQNDKPILRGRMVPPNHRRFGIKLRRYLRDLTFRGPNTRPSFRISQELGSNIAGYSDSFLLVGHHPHPLRKSVLEEFFENTDDSILQKQISHRFRNVAQYNQVSLSNHLEMAKHQANVIAPVGVAYIRPETKNRTSRRTLENIRNDIEPYGCIQSLDQCPPNILENLRLSMTGKFGKYLPAQIVFEGG